MIRSDKRGFFEGSELSRLLTLVAAAVLGGAVVLTTGLDDLPAQEVPPQAGPPPVAIHPDPDPAFEAVTDKTVLGFRDTAAYKILLDRARTTSAADLAAKARTDVQLAQIYERPAHYRGVPIHLLGTVRRVLRYESKLSPSGWLYEAWIFTPDSQNFPYVCVFEEAPAGLPIGPALSERAVFNGYFLKLMRYEAGDVPRAAPLLVGRIGWTAAPPSTTIASGRSPRFWLIAIVGMLFLASLFRWIRGLRRLLVPRTESRAIRSAPNEEIAPAALAQWVDTVADDAERLRQGGLPGQEESESRRAEHDS